MNAYARTPLSLLALLAVLAGTPSLAAGQSESSSPVFVAIPQTFPDVDARAVVMREPGRDIVLLREDDAVPETLNVALAVLARMTRDHPLDGTGQMIPIMGYASRRDLSPGRRAVLGSVLRDLRERPLSNVGNLGTGRWMRFRR